MKISIRIQQNEQTLKQLNIESILCILIWKYALAIQRKKIKKSNLKNAQIYLNKLTVKIQKNLKKNRTIKDKLKEEKHSRQGYRTN